MHKTMYEMMMLEENLHEVISHLLNELGEVVPKLDPSDQQMVLEIYTFMAQVHFKMVNVFFRSPDEKLLSYIEQFQGLMKIVKSKYR